VKSNEAQPEGIPKESPRPEIKSKLSKVLLKPKKETLPQIEVKSKVKEEKKQEPSKFLKA
jgi:hypothetical protein